MKSPHNRSASEVRTIFVENLSTLVARERSVAELARKLELNRSQLNRYLSGEATPRPEVLDRICGYFGVDARILLEPLTTDHRHAAITTTATAIADILFDKAAPLSDDFLKPGLHMFWRQAFNEQGVLQCNLMRIWDKSGAKFFRFGEVGAAKGMRHDVFRSPIYERRQDGVFVYVRGGACLVSGVEGGAVKSFGYVEAFNEAFARIHAGFTVIGRPAAPGRSRVSPFAIVILPQTTRIILSAARQSGAFRMEEAPPEIQDVIKAQSLYEL